MTFTVGSGLSEGTWTRDTCSTLIIVRGIVHYFEDQGATRPSPASEDTAGYGRLILRCTGVLAWPSTSSTAEAIFGSQQDWYTGYIERSSTDALFTALLAAASFTSIAIA